MNMDIFFGKRRVLSSIAAEEGDAAECTEL